LPADAIRRAAAGADLIVMGTHGRSGFNRLMLGSVTERVLRESEVPVLAVRGDADAQPQIRHILCPVNDSDAARAALRKAAQLAACTGAVVTALHVKEPGAKDSIDNLCGWIPGELRPQCEIRELSTHGEVAREVIAMASELKVDLIVLGARHKAFFDTSVIGANTIRMVRHAHSPVLMVFAT
jgi:nucleotide-binding universal stress UspA family protein